MKKRSGSRFAGKVLLSKRETKANELDRLVADRESLLEQVKQVDGLIAATRAYIRELDIRTGAAPDDRRLRGTMSIRDMSLQVLDEAGHPMTVTEIRKAIEARFNQQIERTSLSPILSKMAQAGRLRHEDYVGWSVP
jgi:hypothetical protein